MAAQNAGINARGDMELDAITSAHRRLLVLLLTTLTRDPQTRRAVFDQIEQTLLFHDGHEDPGVEADGASAFEHIAERELRGIVADVKTALAVLDSAPQPVANRH